MAARGSFAGIVDFDSQVVIPDKVEALNKKVLALSQKVALYVSGRRDDA